VRPEDREHVAEAIIRSIDQGEPNRAQAGQTRTASRTSVEDISPQRRGGQRSHSGAKGPTYDQLYNEARRRNVHGRSKMNKSQLAHALGKD
jgi:hypothetical protein